MLDFCCLKAISRHCSKLAACQGKHIMCSGLIARDIKTWKLNKNLFTLGCSKKCLGSWHGSVKFVAMSVGTQVMLLYARNAQVLWLAFAFLFPFDTALEPYLGIPERFRTVLASNLHAKNGSERFSVMARYMLSILIDSCRTVVVVLAPVLPHNVVDVELLVPDVRLLRSCSSKHVWIFLCVVPGSLFSTSQKSPKTDDVMCCN